MHETFWTLLRDRAHWEFEIFLMVVFDVMLAAIWRFAVRFKDKSPIAGMKTPQGICDDCGGMLHHLIERGLELCRGCGDVKVIAPVWNGKSSVADEWTISCPSVNPIVSTDVETAEKPAKSHDGDNTLN